MRNLLIQGIRFFLQRACRTTLYFPATMRCASCSLLVDPEKKSLQPGKTRTYGRRQHLLQHLIMPLVTRAHHLFSRLWAKTAHFLQKDDFSLTFLAHLQVCIFAKGFGGVSQISLKQGRSPPKELRKIFSAAQRPVRQGKKRQRRRMACSLTPIARRRRKISAQASASDPA